MAVNGVTGGWVPGNTRAIVAVPAAIRPTGKARRKASPTTGIASGPETAGMPCVHKTRVANIY